MYIEVQCSMNFFLSQKVFFGLAVFKVHTSEFLPHVVYVKVGIMFDLDVC